LNSQGGDTCEIDKDSFCLFQESFPHNKIVFVGEFVLSLNN